MICLNFRLDSQLQLISDNFRIEHDLLGNYPVPKQAYYGIHTQRARENFQITGTAISVHRNLIVALACAKQAAAN